MLAVVYFYSLLLVWATLLPLAHPVPLLLWGVTAPQLPALYTLEYDDLEDIIYPMLRHKMFIVYIADKLEPRDFMCRRRDMAASCFSYLPRVKPRSYYMQVQQPLQSIENIMREPVQRHTVNLARREVKQFRCQPGAVHYVRLKGNQRSRWQLLQAHDAYMRKFGQRHNCSSAHIYTSDSQPVDEQPMTLFDLYHVKRLSPMATSQEQQNQQQQLEEAAAEHMTAAEATQLHAVERPAEQQNSSNSSNGTAGGAQLQPDYIFINERFVFRYQDIVYYKGGDAAENTYRRYGKNDAVLRPRRGQLVHVSGMTTVPSVVDGDPDGGNIERNGYTVIFDSTPIKVSMELQALRWEQRYKVQRFIVDDEIFGTAPFTVTDSSSFVCNQLLLLGKNNTMIRMNYIQFEIVANGTQAKAIANATENQTAEGQPFSFKKPDYCCIMFTANILSGLLVAALMLGIVSIGVLMIMDIGSHRYVDDPNGPELHMKTDD